MTLFGLSAGLLKQASNSESPTVPWRPQGRSLALTHHLSFHCWEGSWVGALAVRLLSPSTENSNTITLPQH